MTTMRAVVIFTSGGPEVVRLEEIDRPALGSGEVLLEVHAAGMNPSDLRGRSAVPTRWKKPAERTSAGNAGTSKARSS